MSSADDSPGADTPGSDGPVDHTAGADDLDSGKFPAEPDADDRPPLDIGVILAGHLKSRHRQLIARALKRLERDLAHWFPNYRWSLQTRTRRDIGDQRRDESTRLLMAAATERDLQAWDFALLITGDELIARFRATALAALSRPLDSALISTNRLIPEHDTSTVIDPQVPDDTRIVDRLATLMLHALSHLGGVAAARDADHVLYRPHLVSDLDSMADFDPAELAELDASFRQLAEDKLEERGGHRGSRLRFLASAAWINREQIVESIVSARPWEFPRHLSRLTTAAVSTVAILLMTAESWDLGLSQSPTVLVTMALLVLAFTTAFVVVRQRLWLRPHRHLREQIMVTSLTAVFIVLTGLAVTWACMYALALLASAALFNMELILSWAASVDLDPTDRPVTLVRMSAFCASIGLLIGSLGASFEDQHHFQHVIFVDEEL